MKLQTDIKRLEEERMRLLSIEAEEQTDGRNVRQVTGGSFMSISRDWP